MLVVHVDNEKFALDNVYDFFIVTEYEGNKTLQFSMSPKDEKYAYIQEEVRITYEDCRYTIKQINERSNAVTVVCDLDMDDWKKDVYLKYAPEKSLSFSQLMSDILVTGWEVVNADLVESIGVTISLEQVSKYQILMEAKKWFGITYEIHNEPVDGIKKIIVKKPTLSKNNGVYLSEELNLTKLEVKCDSTDLVTRLYPYSVNGDEIVDITSVAEKEYIEDDSQEVISAIWMTEGYSNPQDLYDAALEYFKTLSVPKREYSCFIVDLAKMNSDYSDMKFNLYDRVTLLDSKRKQSLEFMIIQYTEYPLEPQRNIIKLSNDYKKISGTVQGSISKVKNTNIQTSNNHQYENYVVNDNTVNSVRISDIWSTGESVYTQQSLHKQTDEFQNIEIYEERKINDVTRNIQSVSLLQNINGIVTNVCKRILENDNETECVNYYFQWNENGIILKSTGNDTETYSNEILQNGYRVLENENVVFEVDKDKIYGKQVQLANYGSLKIGPFLLLHRSNGHLTLKKGEG